MPYKIEKQDSGKYRVINTDTGHVHGTGMTYKTALAQFRLLWGIERGWVPDRRDDHGTWETIGTCDF